MSLGSQMAMEDVGALFLGSSLLMDDPLGPLLDNEEELQSGGRASSPLSLSSYADSSPSSSPFPCLSPPPSPPTQLDSSKTSLLPSLPWLSADELLSSHIGADDGKGDAFSGMDWMAEKIDLSDFDLDSLIGSYESDDPPSSPEELLASLESHMDLDLDPLVPPSSVTSPEEECFALSSPLPPPELPTPAVTTTVSSLDPEVASLVPEPAALEIEIKSEPSSPVPSPLTATYTLELGSEVDVDVSELEKVVSPVVAAAAAATNAESLQASSIVLSLSPSHIVVVLASPKEEPGQTPSSCEEQSDSDSGIGSVVGSPLHQTSPPPSPVAAAGGSSRTKPYSKPDPDAAATGSSVGSKVKTVSGAPKVVEKKLKKMEQNKTAATRYRQKKRVEQDQLNSECTDLEKRNLELAEKADSISREIQYLTDLLEEVRSAKNRRTKSSSA